MSTSVLVKVMMMNINYVAFGTDLKRTNPAIYLMYSINKARTVIISEYLR